MSPPGRLAAAIRFLTILPLPGKLGTTEEELKGSLLFFPLVGALIGLVMTGAAGFGHLVFPPYLTALFLTLILAVCSGGLHLDGLADTADGFFSSRPKEQILEIMRDSATGAMGVIALIFLLIFKVICLGTLASGTTLLAAVFLMPLAGRCAILLLMAMLPYARPGGGLATLFYSQNSRIASCCGWLCFLIAAVIFSGWQGGVTVFAIGLLVTVFAWYCKRKIGGATGDTLGAVCELAEAAVAFMFVLLSGAGS